VDFFDIEGKIFEILLKIFIKNLFKEAFESFLNLKGIFLGGKLMLETFEYFLRVLS
jgi:hypothetical protein